MLHPNYANDEILICDPEGEFGALVKALGREKATVAHLVAGGKDKLNSMYMVEGYGEQNPIVEKSQFVMSLIEQIDKRGVGPQHKSIIDRCTALVYPEAEKEGRARPCRQRSTAGPGAGGRQRRACQAAGPVSVLRQDLFRDGARRGPAG